MKKEVFWAGTLVVFFSALIALSYWHKPPVQAVPTPCVAQANEQCPSADWMRDYEGWKKLDDEINASEKPKKDLRTGWASRLNDTMPPGYYFNVDTHKFQKREAVQAPNNNVPFTPVPHK